MVPPPVPPVLRVEGDLVIQGNPGAPQAQPIPLEPIQATATATSDAGITAIISTFKNEKNTFPNLGQIRAPDAIVAGLAGRFASFDSFAALPREMRAAPDATSWAGVQLWSWWSPPDVVRAEGWMLSQPRRRTIWVVLHAAWRAAEHETLSELPPEIWLLIFTF